MGASKPPVGWLFFDEYFDAVFKVHVDLEYLLGAASVDDWHNSSGMDLLEKLHKLLCILDMVDMNRFLI